MDLDKLSDDERLILGLRFRLKHVRLAIADAEAGRVPDGFEFSSEDSQQSMLNELRRIESDVQGMLRSYGADDSGRLN